MYRAHVKRWIDVVLALAGLLVAGPVMLIVAAAIRLEDGGPALFRQTRVGKDGAPFTLFKFRSMPVATPNVPSTQASQLTVTRVGRFIRRTNLDELPQLINVLRGDMSIVGPRPALAVQEDLLAERRRNGAAACRPGLTGLAQINSYDGMPVDEKALWDGRYAGQVTLRTFGYLSRRPPVY
jgi:O-antigen biosynthesis protein WbqP